MTTIIPMFAVMVVCFFAWGQQRRRGDFRRDVALKVGDPAPDFALRELHGQGKVKLSSFRGKRPVVLIFGSYT